MLENRTRNVELVQAHFPAESILSISTSEADDEMVWCLNPGGKYSISSGYKLAFELFHPPIDVFLDYMKSKDIWTLV